MSEKNVVIRFTAQSDLEGANAELQSLQDREKDIQLEMRKQQAEYQKQVAAIQSTVKGREQQIAALDKLRESQTKQQASLEQELKKTKATLTDFSQKMSKVNETIANGAVSTPRLTTQLRAMKDELAKMEDAGEFGSKAFIDLSIQAGQLEDQIGDTRQRISILASDTKNLDAAMSVGSGLAGAFTVATSAAALLGDENEQLQKAFFKVQAVMSILNGVQVVANTLNKDSAAMVVIKTALENNNTIAKIKNYTATKIQAANTILETAANNGSKVAKIGATATQWALNAAVYAFPAVMIIGALAAIGTGLYLWSKNAKETEKQQENLTFQIESTNKQITKLNSESDFNVGIAEAAGASVTEIRKIRYEALKTQIALAEMMSDKVYSLGTKATKEQREESQKMLDDAYAAEKKYFDEGTILLIKTLTDRKKEAVKKTNETEKELLKFEIESQNAIDFVLNKRTDAYKKWEETLMYVFKEMNLEVGEEEEAYVENWLTTLSRKKDLGLITEADYLKQKLDYLIKSNASVDAISEAQFQIDMHRKSEEVKAFQRKEQRKQELIQQSAQIINTIGDAVFDNQYNKLQQQQSDLEHYYTTDAEEAKKNKNLKLITEEEFNNKQLQLKRKMAKLDKEQAMFNIALATAQAIISALVSIPPNVPLSIYAGVLGGIQLAAAASKPLPKYAKGKRAGGKGHFAMVGELGPETMWVPDGAGIVPNGLDLNYSNLSRFNIPDLPDFDSKYMSEYSNQSIDYDKLGKAVADNINIPTPKPITVNIDKNGITTESGYQRTTHLNKKYTGTWK